jgi:hypothetical protein
MDLTGGMSPDVDEITAKPPDRPDFLEGANMWIWDDAGQVGLPRIAVDAVGARWTESYGVSVNVTLPGNRVLIVRGSGAPHPVEDDKGRPRVLGAGPLALSCEEPFARWRLTFDGMAAATTTEEQIANRHRSLGDVPRDGSGVRLRIEVDARMAVAPWVPGNYEPDGHVLATEHRIEQLFSAAGVVEVDAEAIPFGGGGVRIHRKGNATRSDYSDWLGHVWMSALFPSGRAFGIDNFHPHPDGSLRYHEGWVLDQGEIVAAKFVEAPWKKEWTPSGEDVSFTLRTRRGDVRIEAETHGTVVNAVNPIPGRPTFPSTQQGIIRCRWDGEEAYGMIERSSRLETPATG